MPLLIGTHRLYVRQEAMENVKMIAKLRRIPERVAWWCLITAAKLWASRYMDQWEKVQFGTRFGSVYFTLTLKVENPNSFEKV